MIVDERIVTFINSLDTRNSEILETIENEARAAEVPIIRREMQRGQAPYLAASGGVFVKGHMDTGLPFSVRHHTVLGHTVM